MAKMTRGAMFRKGVLAEFDLGDPVYGLLLDEISAVVDEMDSLPLGSVVERRQQRTLLSRLLSQLALPGEDDGKPQIPPAKSVHARRAAEARWRNHATPA